ncbi:MAG: hypothetical protein K0R67_2590 [Paenibacillus sp.]|jgi:hypothetical protein|nr:hypothetical protein [Paenibacillus sp.]
MTDKALEAIRGRKPIQVIHLRSTDYTEETLLRICNDYLKDHYYIAERYPVFKLGTDNIWVSDPFKERSWRFSVHTLIMLEYLIQGYERFSDRRYLDKAVSIMRGWTSSNCPESASEMAWHDHSTALRLVVVCRLFEVWRRGSWDLTTAKQFAKLAEIHCIKLSNSGFYRKKHNHGLDQDIALYTGATVFDHLERAGHWRKLAMNRAIPQLSHLFAADGSYREHSPGYAMLFLKRMYHFMSFLQQHKDMRYTTLKTIICKELEFITHVLQPNGLIPPIGDSLMSSFEQGPWMNLNTSALQGLQYVISQGRKGKRPAILDAMFPFGGYAVMRNKWEYDAKSVQLVLYSGFHSKVHKHHDDLALTLFAFGQPLLTDAGMFNYNYESAGRNYVISARAHNTVVVDHINTNLNYSNVGRSGLKSSLFTDRFGFASGVHCLYSGVVHQRIIFYHKPWDILVFDLLHSSKEHRYEQMFNFFPNVGCELNGFVITASVNSKLMSMEPLLKESIETTLVRGQTKPLRGWYSSTHGKLTAAWSAAYGKLGKSTKFATHIRLDTSSSPIRSFRWEDDIIRFRFGDHEIQIKSGRGEPLLMVDHKQLRLNSINQPVLDKAIRKYWNNS